MKNSKKMVDELFLYYKEKILEFIISNNNNEIICAFCNKKIEVLNMHHILGRKKYDFIDYSYFLPKITMPKTEYEQRLYFTLNPYFIAILCKPCHFNEVRYGLKFSFIQYKLLKMIKKNKFLTLNSVLKFNDIKIN